MHKFRSTNKLMNVLLLASLLISPILGPAMTPAQSRALAADLDSGGFGSPTIDGVIDDLYGDPIASDPAGDGNGNAPMDLLDLYVAQDADYFYFAYTINTDTSANNWGKYVIYIDTTNDANGATSDAWGRNVVVNDPHKPEFGIYTYLDNPPYDSGDTQLVPWDQGSTSWNWGSASQVDAAAMGSGATSVIEWQVAKSKLGNPDTIWVEVWCTGGGGGDNAQDTINNPADDWNATDWGSQATLAVSTQFGAPLIDGLKDQVWGDPVASDPAGDMSEPNLDLQDLYLLEDADNYYIGFDATASNWGMTYGIYIDTDQVDGSGGNSDPWGRAVNAISAHQPEYALYVFHKDDDTLEDAQLTTWNGAGWDYPTLISLGGAQGYGPAEDWLEYKVPKAALGNPTRIALEVFTTGSGGHAQDTVPSDPNVAYSDPDWSAETTTLSAFYIHPPQDLSLTVTTPSEGQAFATADINVTGQVVPSMGVTVTVDLNGTDLYTPTIDFSGAFTQPVTLVKGENTLTIHADDGSESLQVVRHVSYGAAHDDNIWWSELGHNSRDGLYRTPFGAVTAGETVTLRLRAASGDLTSAQVRLYNDRTNSEAIHDMNLVLDDGEFEWWQFELDAGADPTVYWYRFVVKDGSATAYYEDDEARTGGWGKVFTTSQDNSWQLTVYDPAFQTPDWMKDAIIYQIFTDRFRDGDPSNNTPDGTFFYGDENGTIYRSNTTAWNTAICDPRDNSDPDCAGTWSQNFYGGDLQGILDKLDYLEDLGITAIYLNPIFESPSNHKYDTTDYSLIDDNFGDLALFQTLASEAAARDMRLILDGVFNHTSSDSIYFDRYERYAEVGACESPASPYRDWYYFTDVTPGTGTCAGSDGTPKAAVYESWWGYDSLPKLKAGSQPVRDLIWDDGTNSIAPYWMQWADGWRLDVGGDVDPGVINDPSNDYWEGFRAAVHAVNPEAVILGEEWGNASSWLLGQEWDAVMNYQYSTAMLGFWRDTAFTDNDHNPGSSAGPIEPLQPTELEERLLNWMERYPPEALHAMMNLLGSHDTNRPLFMLDHNAALGSDDSLLQNPNYDWSDAIDRLKGVAILQMTLPGAPTIYYGDEVGNVGPVTYDNGKWEDDPYNRVPYPWLDQSGTPFYTFLQSQSNQNALYNYYSRLAATRNAHPALRTGSFDPLFSDDAAGVYAYGRLLPDYSNAALVIVNKGGAAIESETITLDVDGYLPYGAWFKNVFDNQIYVVDNTGQIEVSVPDFGGVVLVLINEISNPPQAVSDLAVTGERNGEIDLGWSAAANASSYDIYRTRLSGGGYEFITNTAGTSYTDSGLENAVTYYYVVVSRKDSNGLVSGFSNEAAGTPAHDLSGAWFNLQWPHEITHTISAITATENIYGQLWINGATGGNGPATGISAQVGYAPADAVENGASWYWVDMLYHAPAGNNDEYRGNLLPEATGDYIYATRWSSDGGTTWYFSDRSGPGDNGNYGSLHVIASADTTAPDAPQDLAVSGTSASSISLEWSANADADLAGYDLYRQEVTGGSAATAFNHVARLEADATSYTDSTVVTDQSYEYYLVAFDTSFNFSAVSNHVTATAEPRMVSVTFEVTAPAYTPGTIFIAGSIPGLPAWDPGGQAMSRQDATTWTFTLEILDGAMIEYKYARGSWDTVEKEADGGTEVPNRQVKIDYGLDGTQLITDVVANWRDPIVVAHSPASDALAVDPGTVITITWNQAMPTDVDFLVEGPQGVVPGSFSYDAGSQTVTFTPDEALARQSSYTVTVSGAVDVHGDFQQVPVSWSFTTGGDWIILLPLLSSSGTP